VVVATTAGLDIPIHLEIQLQEKQVLLKTNLMVGSWEWF
jgi:hypothetical protein